MQSARVFELAPLGRKRLMKSGRECGLKNKHDGKIMARGISSGIDAIVGGKLLVLTFSVVAIGSPLAYMEKRGAPIPTLRLSRLCDLALDQMNEKDEGDARGAKEWKPQNPSESWKLMCRELFWVWKICADRFD